MKKLFLLMCASLGALAASLTPAQAQEPVTTGTVQEVIPKTGVLTLISDQLHRPVTFYGAGQSNIFSTDGTAAHLSDLSPGMRVTVQYAERASVWYISKIMFMEEKAAPITTPTAPITGGRVAPVTIVNGTGKN